ncbi:unannotated protein [freshwater metagenome]|uniref:Unannotated protein n=1 Tax=freshwater metagenome TaxID=449393 RepID=A0A6J7UW55_9ZZZZ
MPPDLLQAPLNQSLRRRLPKLLCGRPTRLAAGPSYTTATCASVQSAPLHLPAQARRYSLGRTRTSPDRQLEPRPLRLHRSQTRDALEDPACEPEGHQEAPQAHQPPSPQQEPHHAASRALPRLQIPVFEVRPLVVGLRHIDHERTSHHLTCDLVSRRLGRGRGDSPKSSPAEGSLWEE